MLLRLRPQTLPLGSFSTLLDPAAGGDASLRSSSSGAGGNPLPPELDWELDGANLELCRREDGTPWQLGQGSFGTVIFEFLAHFTQFARIYIVRLNVHVLEAKC